MARKKRQKSEPLQLNLTSMMDIVFQLIIFFLLVTNFTTNELPELEVPKPDESVAYALDTQRIVVNVMPSDDGEGTTAKELVVDAKIIPSGEEGILTEMLQKAIDERGGEPDKLEVDLRAGSTLAYDQIAPVIGAINQARIARINMVAHQEE